MSGLRVWVLCLVVVSFLCGTATGLLLGLGRQAPPPDRGAFADYHERMVAEFDLSPLRARTLSKLLEHYELEIEAAISQEIAGVEKTLAQKGRYWTNQIRDRIVPPERREEFERLAGLPVGPSLGLSKL